MRRRPRATRESTTSPRKQMDALLNCRPAPPVTSDESFHGFRPLPRRGRPVSNALVDQLREDEWE